jgi:hypothetical protein
MNAILLIALGIGPMFHFRAGGREDFSATTRAQVQIDAAGEVRLLPRAVSGTIKTAELVPDRPFTEAIVSWEASAPEGTWIEMRARARVGERWTRDYVMGIWSESPMRASVDEQKDADGDVATDTLVLTKPATALQLSVTLVSARPGQSPRLRGLHAVVSAREPPPDPLQPDRRAWGIDLGVPPRSQMLYPHGGEVWCSATSTAMVLDYWGIRVHVPEAAAQIYDWMYDGTGNWPFNTAFAAVRAGPALETFVTRLYQVEQLERLIAIGLPIVASVSFGKNEIKNAPIASTDGHLIVVRGFAVNGDVIVNDPAAPWDDLVHLTYNRQAFDRAWSRSGRMIYLMHPAKQPLPESGSRGCW